MENWSVYSDHLHAHASFTELHFLLKTGPLFLFKYHNNLYRMLNQCLFPSIVIFLFNSTFCFITFLAHRTYTSDFFFLNIILQKYFKLFIVIKIIQKC